MPNASQRLGQRDVLTDQMGHPVHRLQVRGERRQGPDVGELDVRGRGDLLGGGD